MPEDQHLDRSAPASSLTTSLPVEVDRVRGAIEDLVYLLDNDRPARLTPREAVTLAATALTQRRNGATFTTGTHVDLRNLRRPVQLQHIEEPELRSAIERIWDELADRGRDLAVDTLATVIGWSDTAGLVIAAVQDTRGPGIVVSRASDGSLRVSAQDLGSTTVKLSVLAPGDVRIVENGSVYTVLDSGRHLYAVPNAIAKPVRDALR